ncbi:MATE family efflux transporter [Confluentibacter sediminis]|uniref:MATE family efflux transporter n=1 Tax=Confluentibacter sediminis TaxID=2219045 RepID=UPI000DACE472|nr:MATE family efflux transporter [Confluentibacter sediminis]
MQDAKRVANNTGILYLRMVITVFISLYVTRLVLAALGTEDFGIFSVVGGAITMLTFLNAAMTSATQRFMSYAKGEANNMKLKNIFNVSLILHFLIAIAITVILEVAGYFFFNGVLEINPERINAAKLIYQFLIVSTFFTIISVPYDAVINANENMLFVAIIGVIEAFLKLAIAYYVTYTVFDKLISYGFLMAILIILLLVCRQLYCHIKYEEVDINLKKYKDKLLFKEMSRFAGWSLLGSSSGMLSNYGQGIVLNMYFGTLINASQGISNQVNGQLSSFSNTMLKALNPVIAKSEGAGNRKMLISSVKLGSKFSYFLLSFFAIPVIIEMPLILNLWLKDVPDYAVTFCRLLLIKNLHDQLFVTLAPAIAAVGNIKKYQIYISLLAFTPLIITAILFSMGYEPYVLYIVFIIQSAARSYFITLYHANKNLNLSISGFLNDVVFRCLSVALIVFIIGSLLHIFLEVGYLRLSLVIIICSILNLLGLAFIVLKSNEKKIIYELILPIIKRLGIIKA